MAVEVNTQLDCLELSTYDLHAPRLRLYSNSPDFVSLR